MGGHGGLNILPQKRWNVYNFDNREKVKRDEEEAARQEAIERQQARQREAEARLEKLRESAQAKKRDPSELRITDGGGAEQPLPEIAREDESEAVVEAARPQHFSLFDIGADAAQGSAKAKGSKDWINDLKVHSRGGLDKQDIRELKKMEKAVRAPEDEGYEFGSGLIGKSGKKPWYSTKRFMVERSIDESGRSRKRSSSPDEERPEKRSRRKEEKLEKHAKKKEKKSKSGRKTIEELRAERVQREQQERDKARKVVIANKSMNGDNGYGNVNPSGRPYYHQSFGNAR